MEFHEYANIFPLMNGAELDELVEDIRKNGLLEDIVVYDGVILDGRNRFNACDKADVEPMFIKYNGDDPLGYVTSKNLHRRHLTEGQKGMAAAKAKGIRERLETENKENKKRKPKSEVQNSAQQTPADNRTRNKLGKMFGVSHDTVDKSTKLLVEKPELAEQVEKGEKTLNRAWSEHRKEERLKEMADTEPLPETKYRVIYADPPWKYNDSGLQEYGHAEFHYPAMTIQELCDMEISELASDDSVLFLWVTSPFLEDSFRIIKAWGFQYKTSFVWDKVGHNFGHYNSVRHELLLICTRGSCTPDSDKLHDSVISIEKTREHSRKPEYFRELIDEMYPHGKRIELFSRGEFNGWETWGNQANGEHQTCKLRNTE